MMHHLLAVGVHCRLSASIPSEAPEQQENGQARANLNRSNIHIRLAGAKFMALFSYPEIEKLPQRVPLDQALSLPTDITDARRRASVGVLKLSIRPAKCLAKNGILSIHQLISFTISELYDIPGMGLTSVEEIVRRVRTFFIEGHDPSPSSGLWVVNNSAAWNVATPAEWVLLTLREEWDTFSCGSATARLPLSALPLSPESRETLRATQCASIDALLEWTWERTRQELGEDGAEELLDALLTLAQEGGEAREAPRHMEPPFFEENRKLLEARWAQCPVDQCGLERRTSRLLQAAKIRTLRQLLDALDPLHPALCLDLPAFEDLWNRLVALELRHGAARTQWEQLVTPASCRIDLGHVITEMQSVCRAKQWTVLNLRYGLLSATSDVHKEGERYTLEDVGRLFGLTRERIRQIEFSALERLERGETASWNSLAATLYTFLDSAGGVLSVTDAAQKLTAHIPATLVDAKALCHLLFELSKEVAPIQRGSIYGRTSFPASYYSLVIERAVKTLKNSLVVLPEQELKHRVQQSLKAEGHVMSASIVAACLRTDGRFSSDFRRHDLTFLLLETLRQIGHPAHFTEIAAKLNASGWRPYPTSEKSVGGRLGGAHDLFVYVGVGTYGLVEWGAEDKRVFGRSKNGSVGDSIEEFLTERGEPANTSEIIAVVLSRKRCHASSILQRLSDDDRFHAFGHGRFGLKKWVR